MGDPQRRRHGQKVPELVPGAFLQPCRSVRLHNFADVASELGERGADMAMFYDKRLGKVVRGSRRLYTLQNRAGLAKTGR